ncbi:MAG: VCBS repeat-containing protein [Chloroflexi bacterium]|nr:VCBS repeat-containing protein [Chloroflexota bacterium]
MREIGRFAAGVLTALALVFAYRALRPPPASDSETPAEPTAASDWTRPGLAMTERLAAIQRDVEADPSGNLFANIERVQAFEAAGIPADPADAMGWRARLAFNQLYAGQTEAAIEGLRRMESELAANVAPEDTSLAQVRMLLAVAWLRLGEQTNCIQRHSADACLLPLRGSGLHQDQNPARQAVATYETILARLPEDLTARWMLNIAYMALGEYPDGVPEPYRIPESLLASDADIGRFRDVAPELGVDWVGNAGGAVMDDLDGDGDLDLAFSSQALTGPLAYFENLGDGRFADRSQAAGLEGLWGGLYLNQADYDNDGDLDLFVARGAWLGEEGRHPNSLLANDGKGRFEDVTEAAGLLSFHPTQVAVWGDYDNDGWLDLFVGNETLDPEVVPLAFGQEAGEGPQPHPSELYRNQGDGTFRNLASEAGLDVLAFVKGAAWGDYDNDGRIDLYVSVDGGPNRLFHNQGPDAAGRWRFDEVGQAAGVSQPRFSFSTWFFDYDNDGWEDLLVADYGQPEMGRTQEYVAGLLGLPTEGDRPYLYRNRGDCSFEELGQELGLDTPTFTMGSNFGDFDNDGWLDIYLATGDPWFESLLPNRAFRNDAGRGFQEITASAGLGHIQKGHGIAFGDVDLDGDQDILDNQGGAYAGDTYPKALFLNPGNANRWITLILEGTEANRGAVGTRLRLEIDTPSGPRQLFRTVGVGSSFGGNSLRQEIGLGDATAISAVELRWPGGESQRFADLPLDRTLRLRQGSADAEPFELAPIPIGSAP